MDEVNEVDSVDGKHDPWWLAGGEEECPRCMASYAYEVEVRCVECDGPMCPVCAVWSRERLEVFCPECREGEQG